VPVPVADFERHVFGVVLVNDWSARDIQAWEYVPLGPFLGKSFATSVSQWVVPLAALQHARVPATVPGRALLPYLREDRPRGLDVNSRSTGMATRYRACRTRRCTGPQLRCWHT
jgi:fumarylacetoacetase